MTEEEHRERHKLLHEMFDELLADYIANGGDVPSRTPITTLMEWSYRQTRKPDHEGDSPI